MPVRRGQIYFANFGPIAEIRPGESALEIALRRPVLVLSIDAINRLTDARPFLVTVVPGTTGTSAFRPFPTNVRIATADSGLREETVFLAHQIRAIDSRRLDARPAGRLSDAVLSRVETAVRYTMGLGT